MSSPINLFAVNPTFFVTSEVDKDAPFNVKWLAEHFNFDDSDVKKSNFDSINVMFEVHFKSDKESVAQKFYESLLEKGCHPQYFKFNNSVCLNKHQKEKILSAGSSTFTPNSSQTSTIQEEINPLNHIIIQDLAQPIQRLDMSLDETRLQHQPEAPFNLSWLEENYKLDVNHVKSAKFSSLIGCGFEVEFKPDAILARNAFIAALTKAGCEPEYNQFSNTVELSERQKEKLLSGSEIGKTFIPPIESVEAIDPILRKGILLTQFFLGVIPFVQAMKQFYAQDQNDSWVQACGVNYRQDNAKMERFIKEIEPHLPFLRKILFNNDYKLKLEYYFITEKELISQLECFVKTKTTDLYQSLLNAFS